MAMSGTGRNLKPLWIPFQNVEHGSIVTTIISHWILGMIVHAIYKVNYLEREASTTHTLFSMHFFNVIKTHSDLFLFTIFTNPIV